MLRALLVDSYDSFIYSLFQYVSALGVDSCVVRNDQVNASFIQAYKADFVVLGPGPGHPKDAGYVEIIKKLGRTTPILGVCLGHQAIGLAYGGDVVRAVHIRHGKTSQIFHDQKGCFSAYRHPFKGMRYHSLIVDEERVPDCLTVSAYSEDDHYVMGLRHKVYPVESIQFHPESIGTEHGISLISGFISTHVHSPMM